jgi:hypothetical protein
MAKTKTPGLKKLVMKNWKGIGFGTIAALFMFGPNLLGMGAGAIAGGYIYQNWKLIKRK